MAVTFTVPVPVAVGVCDQLQVPSLFAVTVPTPLSFAIDRVLTPSASANFPLAVCARPCSLLLSAAAVAMVGTVLAVQVNSSVTFAPLLSVAVTFTVPVPAAVGVCDQFQVPSLFAVTVPAPLSFAIDRVLTPSASANFPLAVCARPGSLLLSAAAVATLGLLLMSSGMLTLALKVPLPLVLEEVST